MDKFLNPNANWASLQKTPCTKHRDFQSSCRLTALTVEQWHVPAAFVELVGLWLLMWKLGVWVLSHWDDLLQMSCWVSVVRKG